MKIVVRVRGDLYIVDLLTLDDETINGFRVSPDEIEEIIISK